MNKETMCRYRNQMLVLDQLLADVGLDNRLWTDNEDGEPRVEIHCPGGMITVSYLSDKACVNAHANNGNLMLHHETESLHRLTFLVGVCSEYLRREQIQDERVTAAINRQEQLELALSYDIDRL